MFVLRIGIADPEIFPAFLAIPVMGPTARPVTLGLAAKRYVISQSSVPRFDPAAPRNNTSPTEKPLNAAPFTLPVRKNSVAL